MATTTQLISALKSQPPTFMSLPGEVQNLIYRYALLESPIEIGSQFENLFTRTALLQTNAQIRNDAQSIFYAENHFILTLSENNGADVIHQIKALGRKQTRWINSLEVVFEVPKLFTHAIRNYIRVVEEQNVELEDAWAATAKRFSIPQSCFIDFCKAKAIRMNGLATQLATTLLQAGVPAEKLKCSVMSMALRRPDIIEADVEEYEEKLLKAARTNFERTITGANGRNGQD